MFIRGACHLSFLSTISAISNQYEGRITKIYFTEKDNRETGIIALYLEELEGCCIWIGFYICFYFFVHIWSYAIQMVCLCCNVYCVCNQKTPCFKPSICRLGGVLLFWKPESFNLFVYLTEPSQYGNCTA